MTTTQFSAYQMADEYGRHTFDVYSHTGFVGHFKAETAEDAKRQAQAKV